MGLTHIERTSVVRTGSGDPWPDSVGVKVGLAPIPSLNFKLRRLALSDECLEVPVPVLLQTRSNAARFSEPRSVMVSISRLTLSVLKARPRC